MDKYKKSKFSHEIRIVVIPDIMPAIIYGKIVIENGKITPEMCYIGRKIERGKVVVAYPVRMFEIAGKWPFSERYTIR